MSHAPRIAILFGSESDRPTMEETAKVLDSFGVSHEMHHASAHRSPEKVREIVASAPGRGVRLFIAAAGMANHLAGTVAAHTTLPVIGVPGAKNAAILAVQILALADPSLQLKLEDLKERLARGEKI